ncbi:uncharacterized protein LOC110116859 isoform X2 [Athalia rosae]|uniref:uncharacterized protein LOC110116859 isoform X2 n=1 Tax=Athalia rosae TaxID=37344 RepID=UPI0020345FD2|nr:uncharacterized protein LOC110116859 isoform X2 [Athalia rosae]
MAERKNGITAVTFKSIIKDGSVETKTRSKATKMLSRELEFFDVASKTDQDGELENKILTKLQVNLRGYGDRIGPARVLVYDETEDSDEYVRTTPPNIQLDKYVATPGAPIKSRKEFDKKVLRPKKLVYSDKENEDSRKSDQNCNCSFTKSTGKKQEDRYDPYNMDEFKIKPRLIVPMTDEEFNYATPDNRNIPMSSKIVVSDNNNYNRSQGIRKKQSTRSANETGRTSKSTIPKNHDDKENNHAILRMRNEQELTRQSILNSYAKNRWTHNRNDRFGTSCSDIREDSANSLKPGEFTHFRI